MFIQSQVKNPMCESSPVFVLKLGFFNPLICVAIVPHSLHLPHQTKPLPPSQWKVLWTKERDDIRRRTSKY